MCAVPPVSGLWRRSLRPWAAATHSRGDLAHTARAAAGGSGLRRDGRKRFDRGEERVVRAIQGLASRLRQGHARRRWPVPAVEATQSRPRGEDRPVFILSHSERVPNPRPSSAFTRSHGRQFGSEFTVEKEERMNGLRSKRSLWRSRTHSVGGLVRRSIAEGPAEDPTRVSIHRNAESVR